MGLETLLWRKEGYSNRPLLCFWRVSHSRLIIGDDIVVANQRPHDPDFRKNREFPTQAIGQFPSQIRPRRLAA